MAKRLKPTSRWGEQWFRELSFKAKAILEYMEDKSATEQNGTGIYVADFGLMEFQMGKGFSISESELMELLGSIVDKIDEKTYFITTYFHDHYGDAKDTYAAKVAAKERLQKRGLMDADGKIIRRKWGSLPPVSPDTQPTVPRGSGESPIILDSIESIKEGGVGETNPPSDEKSHDTTLAPESQDPDPPPEKFGPFELAIAWNRVMAKIPQAKDPRKRMPLVDLERFKPGRKRWAQARERLKDDPGPVLWLDAIERMSRSKFCRGGDAQGDWVADIDFLLAKDRLTQILEGKYGCTPKPKPVEVAPPASAPRPPEGPKNPDIVKAMKYAYVPGFTHAPWEDVRSELSQQAAGLIEQHGGWDEFKRRPAEENQALLTRVLNAPTASGNRDHAAQAHAITTGLVQPEAAGRSA